MIDQFRETYSVIPSPMLLVEPSGKVLAYNAAAIREFGISPANGPDHFYLQTLFSNEESVQVDYLRLCARTRGSIPAGFSARTIKETHYSCRGQLLRPSHDGHPAQVVLFFQSKEKAYGEFLWLNEKIRELSKEIRRRQDLEDERRKLLEREKTAKEEAERLYIKAEEASRVKSLFLAQMSHEIRTPLNAILGFSDLLSETAAVDEQGKDSLNRIKTNGRLLLRIINDVLDLSKFEAGKVAVENVKFSVVEMISEVVNSLKPLASTKGLELLFKFKTAVPQVIQSDPTRLRQVLLNLVGNAIKFTDHGYIQLEISFSSSRGERQASQLVIEVLDTGIGITAEQQSRLFQAFEQGDTSTSRRFGGTGLGLAISRRIANALGGDLELLRTEKDKGSCFKLSIPTGDISETLFVSRAQEAYLHLEQALHVVNGSEKQLLGVRILLAEDSLDGAALVTLYLQMQGAEVTHVMDGFAATKAADAGDFDLILMDIQMPGMDGLEATRRLRSNGFVKPIFALTAHALRDEIERSFSAGCNVHMTKPIDKNELVSQIKNALVRKSARNL